MRPVRVLHWGCQYGTNSRFFSACFTSSSSFASFFSSSDMDSSYQATRLAYVFLTVAMASMAWSQAVLMERPASSTEHTPMAGRNPMASSESKGGSFSWRSTASSVIMPWGSTSAKSSPPR